MGDFNCGKHEWNCVTENPYGNVLFNFCMNENIQISAPQACTNFPPTGNPSIIDLFLFKSRTKHTRPISKHQLSSNHNPVDLTILLKDVNVTLLKTYDYEKADWDSFRKQINSSINLNFHIHNREQVEEQVANFHKIISKSIKNNVPLKKENHQTLQLPNNLKALVRFKNKLRKSSQNKPSNLNKILYKSVEKFVLLKIKLFNSAKIEKYLKNLKASSGSL